MRVLLGLGFVLVSLTAAVAQEPPAVSATQVGQPMRIAPAIIGQPMNAPTFGPQASGSQASGPQASSSQTAETAKSLSLLIAPPDQAAQAAAEPLPVQVAGTAP